MLVISFIESNPSAGWKLRGWGAQLMLSKKYPHNYSWDKVNGYT